MLKKDIKKISLIIEFSEEGLHKQKTPAKKQGFAEVFNSY
jgi:hypothetical protein